jgi:hypothetical protein
MKFNFLETIIFFPYTGFHKGRQSVNQITLNPKLSSATKIDKKFKYYEKLCLMNRDVLYNQLM